MFHISKQHFILFLTVLIGGIISGCGSEIPVRPEGFRPFVPVHFEFGGTYRDDSVEKILRERLFCKQCVFEEAGQDSSPYALKIEYDRSISLKGIGLVIFIGAMAPVEADFSYSLQIHILNGSRILKEYIYTKQTVEKTESAFDGVFTPLSKSDENSSEVFSQLIDTFIRDVARNKPLPQI